MRRFAPLYCGAFLQGLVFWYAVEKLFMKSIGLNAETIALITILFTIVMGVINIPAGVLADRWSRKGVLMLASVALVLSCVISGLSHGFWIYAVGVSFWGIFYACYLGTYDSVVYDVLLEETGSGEGFEYYYGRIQVFDSVALVVGSLCSAVITHSFGLRATYFVTLPFSAGSLIALAAFREPRLHKRETATLIKTHLAETFRAILQKGQIFWIVISLVFITIGLRMVLEFDQLWLIALALPVVLFGPVNALALSSVGTSGLLAHYAKNKHGIVLLAALLLAADSFAFLVHSLVLVVVSIALTLMLFFFVNIIMGKCLHDALSSRVRAGASSIVTTVGYILFLPAALGLGVVAKHATIFKAGWILVGVCIGILAGMYVSLRPSLKSTG